MKRLLAALAVAVLVAGAPLAPATRAQAATSASIVCSKWITTYAGTAGVTIYRGHQVCYGSGAKEVPVADRVHPVGPVLAHPLRRLEEARLRQGQLQLVRLAGADPRPGRHQDGDAMTTVIELPPPMQCIACGRNAQYVVNGTSWCRLHKHPRG